MRRSTHVDDQDRARASKRQVNIWLSEEERNFLRTLAREREQSVSALIRRAIAVWRRQLKATQIGTEDSTGSVPRA